VVLTTAGAAARAAETAARAPARATPGGVKKRVPSAGKPPEILPLGAVRPGMIGEGLTVFEGTKPEPFRVRVLSVLRNFLPKQDIILVRVEDDRVARSGVAAGMSGSPIFVDGKLMGALAYGWAFAKEPLAGITPIEAMLEDSRRPLRALPASVTGAGGDGPHKAVSTGGISSNEPARAHVAAAPVFGQAELKQVSLPLALSGLTPKTFADAQESLADFGMVAVQAGGGGSPSGRNLPFAMEPGAAVGVELIRGDMGAVASGTVTYVDGDKVLAFGHPMFSAGQILMPMVGVEVHTIMPSMASAFKLSSPLDEIGAIVLDQKASITGRMGMAAQRLPVTVTVQRDGASEQPFRAEVARHERLTPLLVSLVTTSALSNAEPDPVDMVVGLETKIKLRGYGELTLNDQVFSQSGLNARVLAGSHGVRALGQIMSNNFEDVDIQSLSVKATVRYLRDTAEIIGVEVGERPVHPGKPVELRVTLRPFGGEDFVRTVSFTVPRHLAGKAVDVEVASGGAVAPFQPRPGSMRELLDNLGRYYTAGNLVVSVRLPESGAALRGSLLAALPPSALDTLAPAHQTPRAEVFRLFDRTVVRSDKVILGKSSLRLAVEEN
jgi:hypothetical protein